MEVIKKIRTRRGANLNIKGKASGNLVGGNLTLLTNTIGTRSEIDTKNKILFENLTPLFRPLMLTISLPIVVKVQSG